ncbi:hypothetical protein CVS40_6042 [Lucilia cuprina]|nr:hypothetical protein CVS40_6042 [Lucilia cuprina]
MPTVPARNFGRNKKYSGDTLSLLGTPQSTNVIRSEVTEVQLKWSTSGMQNCQAAPPPCKYTFWWSSPPKTVGKKSAKAQK